MIEITFIRTCKVYNRVSSILKDQFFKNNNTLIPKVVNGYNGFYGERKKQS